MKNPTLVFLARPHALLLAAVVVSISACGGGSSSAPAGGTPPVVVAPTPTPSASEPTQPGQPASAPQLRCAP